MTVAASFQSCTDILSSVAHTVLPLSGQLVHNASHPWIPYPHPVSTHSLPSSIHLPTQHQKPQSAASVSQQPDPFYGHKPISCLCAKFITHLFACPELPPSSSYFIAYILHRTKLHPSVTFAALVLLQRLKAHFPTTWGSSGHRLFVSTFMLASKVICDLLIRTNCGRSSPRGCSNSGR